MEQFCDNLRCCTNLISGFELQSTCPQCGQGPLPKSRESSFSSNIMQKRPSTDHVEKQSCISSTPDSTASNAVEVSSIKPSTSSESPKRRRIDSGRSSLLIILKKSSHLAQLC